MKRTTKPIPKPENKAESLAMKTWYEIPVEPEKYPLRISRLLPALCNQSTTDSLGLLSAREARHRTVGLCSRRLTSIRGLPPSQQPAYEFWNHAGRS